MTAAALPNRPAGMPAPNDNPVEGGLWRAAAQGRLDIQCCEACDKHRNPPSAACIHCGSFDWRWDTMPGTGVVMTYVWIPDPARKGQDLPSPYYNVAVVELDGVRGPPARIVTNIIDAWQLDDLQVGQRVELACIKLSEEVGLPCFTRVAGSAGQ
ncbi:MAG: hypothetical protein JWP35_24 [Caulobacter sp.]|nr:hypothetical protein [Caulobacter sp.]